MYFQRRIKTFTDKYPFIGPTMWILTAEYFIIQTVAAHAWTNGYSISKNTISDLGNSSCGLYALRYVCSPLHNLMNAAFIALGIFMIVGSLLIYQEFRETKLALAGFLCLFIGGIGTTLVGIFPENTVLLLHVIGAFLPFFIGNLGIVILGYALKLPKLLGTYTLLTGVVALIALAFFSAKHYLGLGEGGMERIVAYPQTLWLIVFGIYMSKNHYVKLRLKTRP